MFRATLMTMVLMMFLPVWDKAGDEKGTDDKNVNDVNLFPTHCAATCWVPQKYHHHPAARGHYHQYRRHYHRQYHQHRPHNI